MEHSRKSTVVGTGVPGSSTIVCCSWAWARRDESCSRKRSAVLTEGCHLPRALNGFGPQLLHSPAGFLVDVRLGLLGANSGCLSPHLPRAQWAVCWPRSGGQGFGWGGLSSVAVFVAPSSSCDVEFGGLVPSRNVFSGHVDEENNKIVTTGVLLVGRRQMIGKEGRTLFGTSLIINVRQRTSSLVPFAILIPQHSPSIAAACGPLVDLYNPTTNDLIISSTWHFSIRPTGLSSIQL
ncbi:hypothetical protein TIFTF001_016988 [Ficus carica]|uniref:Uncharacterized protein n=1 Tax=Ficus carica TaxID=3494 RepID=A0AA88ATW6_FICCA|nr:hypothetical protein TIFTF001_016988 [Ficus carica]